MEEKLKILANNIVNNSIKVKKGDKVLINCQTLTPEILVNKIVELIYKKEAMAEVIYKSTTTNNIIINNIHDEYLDFKKEILNNYDLKFDAFISILYNENDYEQSDLNFDNIVKMQKKFKTENNTITNERRWVLLEYPSKLDAHKASMSSEKYTEFSFNSMTFDYTKLSIDVVPLYELMKKTNKVHITGEGTDITFSIKDIPVIPCVGECNLPDGEIYTAPIKDSVNGYISYNTSTNYRSDTFKNIKLEFKDGKIINASSDTNSDKLNKILDSDEGARYIGEFAIGLNPYITKDMGNILFDEKIIGSIHLTPGAAYKDAYNGNDSVVHMDIVLIQTPEYGGGNIYFDDILIRKNGEFVLDTLKHLNYNNK